MLSRRTLERARSAKRIAEDASGGRTSGSLVQMDGSFHDWYDARREGVPDEHGGRRDLRTVRTHLGSRNDLGGGAACLRHGSKYGVPRRSHTDWKNVYVREPTEKEQLHGQVPVTQFGRMCGSWISGSSRRTRRKPRGAWSGGMGRTRIA